MQSEIYVCLPLHCILLVSKPAEEGGGGGGLQVQYLLKCNLFSK